MTYAFHPIVGCLPSTQLPYDDWDWRARRNGIKYPRIVHPEEVIIHAQREPR